MILHLLKQTIHLGHLLFYLLRMSNFLFQSSHSILQLSYFSVPFLSWLYMNVYSSIMATLITHHFSKVSI